MRRHLLVCVALVLLLSGARVSGEPQAGTGRIRGQVVDAMGAAIGRANVFVRAYSYLSSNDKVELASHSDGSGNFVVTLPAGAYDILVTSTGFESKLQTVVVQAGKTAKVQWKMTVQPCDFPNVNCDTFGSGK